jgi:hypothetical protein
VNLHKSLSEAVKTHLDDSSYDESYDDFLSYLNTESYPDGSSMQKQIAHLKSFSVLNDSSDSK